MRDKVNGLRDAFAAVWDEWFPKPVAPVAKRLTDEQIEEILGQVIHARGVFGTYRKDCRSDLVKQCMFHYELIYDMAIELRKRRREDAR